MKKEFCSKRFVAFLLAITFFVTACGSGTSNESSKTSETANESSSQVDTSQASESAPVNLNIQAGTIEELEKEIETELANSIDALNKKWETLSAEINTYELYCSEVDKVTAFYDEIITDTKQMCIMLCEYSAAYAQMVLDSDMSKDDKYDAIKGINDCIYEDACDEINDEIYDGLLDDINDYYYDGIIDDAQKDQEYKDWYDVSSKEYSQWYDTSSDVYSLYYDTASDIYSFYYNMSGEIYSGDFDRAQKVMDKFKKKIEKMKSKGSSSNITDATFDLTVRSADTIEDLEQVVEEHVAECIQAIKDEWTAFSTENNTIDKYVENVEKVEEFYKHVEDATEQVLTLEKEYAVSYAELVLASDVSDKDKYNDAEIIKDSIYDDACDAIKDSIYDDLLKEMKDYYYEGIVKDAKDAMNYSDWSELRSNEYSCWSDTRSAVYSEYSDTRSDVYSFCSDLRTELYKGDLDGAKKEVEDFKEKLSKGGTSKDSAVDGSSKTETDKDEGEEPTEDLVDGMRPEFKEAMDSYEEFYDSYCVFMKKYKENPTDTTLLAEYADLTTKAVEVNKKFEAWDDGTMNDAETKYYVEVSTRVSKNLLEVAQ